MDGYMTYDYEREKNIKQITATASVVSGLPQFTHSFFYEYCRVVRGMSERTITEYAKDIRIFFLYLVENNPLLRDIADITPDIIDSQTVRDLQEFITYAGSYTSASGSVRVNGAAGLNRKVAALRTFYRYLYANGDIAHNPASILAAPRIRKKEIVRLDRSESDDLLTAVLNPERLPQSSTQARFADRTKYRDRAIIILLLGTGLRISECAGLGLKDISWKNRAMRVIRKGGMEQTVYFNRDIEEALKDYIKFERKSPDEDVDALFVSLKRNRMSVRAMERMVKKYAQASVPQKKITPHRLRATFATELNRANSGNLMQVSAALGHSSIETARKYVDVSDQERQLASALATWTHVFTPGNDEAFPETDAEKRGGKI